MKIGIFDSGIGGEAMASRLKIILPLVETIVVNDSLNVPYGNRSEAEIITLTDKAIQPLINKGLKSIIIACNTATAVAMDYLRKEYPNECFLGVEPMIKPAVLITKTNTIAVCATSGTLKSKRYKNLKETWAKDINVIEPNCSNWAKLIENHHSEDIDIESTVRQLTKANVDVIVLGCTHYHWIKERLKSAVGENITVLEPSDAIAERVKTIID